ncbi:hypothetical protein [Pseudoalteromonas rubra]|uniref:Uncharacterized protein n=1 Tax=Pseudoalteromonas rubra TaxID=43658 RepID=A0A0U2Y320_9GAMM|nr:hypothetical protein [Pseudoalteromonas rubra]ALU44594.1 hypothetical protein AT705_17620 [Pseudoalteromonas rubra]
MQITSTPYQASDTYRTLPKSAENTPSAQQFGQHIDKVNVPAGGFDVRGKVNLIYLLGPEDITEFSGDKSFLADLHTTFKDQTDLEQQYVQKGLQREIGTMIFVDGKAIASQGYDGAIYGQGQAADILNQAGNDPEKIKQLVAQHFPDAHVEFYAEGEGPTNADVFELRYGSAYENYVNEQVQNYSDQYLTNQIAAEENYRRKLMFEQTPQTSVFSVDGQVVASRDDKGFVDVGLPLLIVADERGIARETLKELFRYAPERSPEDYKALLHGVFGGDVELTSYSKAEAPTRAEVRSRAESG